MRSLPRSLFLLRAALPALVLLLAGFAPSRTAFAQGFTVLPLNQTVRSRPSTQQKVRFQVINSGRKPIQMNVQVLDVAQTETGGPKLSAPGLLPRSCAGWIAGRTGVRSILPGQTNNVDLTIAIPARTEGSYHAAVVVSPADSVTLKPGQSSVGFVMQAVLPVHIFITGTEKPALDLNGCTLLPAEKAIPSGTEEQAKKLRGKWALLPDVKNTGNSMVRAKGDVVVTSDAGALMGRYKVGMGNPDGQAILPGATIRFPVLIDSTLPADHYTARLTLTYADKRGYSVPIDLKPHPGGNPELGEVALGAQERTGLQVSVSPSVLKAPIAAQGLHTDRVIVTNYEDHPVSVDASVTPCAIDADGTPVPSQSAAAPTSWLNVMTPHFVLGPRQNRTVILRSSSPQAGQDRWGLVQFRFASRDPQSVGYTGTGSTLVLAQDPSEKGAPPVALGKVELSREAEGRTTLLVDVANTGASAAIYRTTALRMNDSSIPATKPALEAPGEENVVILPGKVRRLPFILPKDLAPKPYQCRVALNPDFSVQGATATELAFKMALTAPRPVSKPTAPAKPNNPLAKMKTTPAKKASPVKKATPARKR